MTTDVVQGSLKLIGLPDGYCWESMEKFLQDFEKLFGVEIPTSITNVIVSPVQPLDDSRLSLWFRLSNSGSFIGIYMYGAGTWNQVYPAPGQLFRLVGNSTTPPAGFILADSSAPGITATVAVYLLGTWHDSGSGYYDVYDAVFVGF